MDKILAIKATLSRREYKETRARIDELGELTEIVYSGFGRKKRSPVVERGYMRPGPFSRK